MTEILEYPVISLIQIVSLAAVRLCVFAAAITIISHFISLIRKKRSTPPPRHAQPVRPRRPIRTVTSVMPLDELPPDPPPEPVIQTGTVVYFANDDHDSADREYRFNYVKKGGKWRAYIIRMPDLQGRDSSGGVTHRLFDSGQPYVCWDSPVSTLQDMKAISKVWADSIQEYIATGKTFG